MKMKMAAEGSSSAVADSAEKQELLKKASELQAQAKRNMVCGEVPKAIALFDEAVQMLAKEYGDLSRNCADAYFSYGSALLELGRMETNVLGVALEGVDVEAKEDEAESDQFEKPPTEDGEERQKLRTEVYDAMAEGEREKIVDKEVKQSEAGAELNKKTDMEDEKKNSGSSIKEVVTDMETDAGSTKDSELKSDETAKVDLKGENVVKDAKALESENIDQNDGNGRSDKESSKNEEGSAMQSSQNGESGSSDKVDENNKASDKVNENNKPSENVDENNKASENVDENNKPSENVDENNKASENVDENNKASDNVNENNKATILQGEENSESAQTESAMDVDKNQDSVSNEKTLCPNGEKESEETGKSELKEKEPTSSPAKILVDKNQEIKKESADHLLKKDNVPTSDDTVSSEDKENITKSNDVVLENTEKEKNKSVAVEMDAAVESKDDKEGEDDVEGEETAEGEEDQEEGEEGQEGEEENKTEESQDEGEEKDEDVPNFQLAWEYLELAKVIYMKSENKEEQLKAAECHLKLGEVSMETEQHATAAEDLLSALKIQQAHLPADDRLIAQTHYQLGLAYGLDKSFEQSIEHYQKAIEAIEAKIASLNKLVEENEKNAENKENCETDELQKYKDEIKELQELIPEMKNKIEDAKTEANDLDKMKQMAKEMLGLSGTSKGFGSPTKKAESAVSSSSGDVDENGEKKATDISSLVRKKRKPEEETSASAVEVKKIKQDGDGLPPVVNGTTEEKTEEITKVNGIKEVTANGDASEAEMKDVSEVSAST